GGACPSANLERHLGSLCLAKRACFGASEPAIALRQSSTMPLRFVLELVHKLGPAKIADCARQLPISHHSFHVERLDVDHLVFADQPRRELVEPIVSYMPNAAISPRHLQTPLRTVLATSGRSSMATLNFTKAPQRRLQRFGRTDFLARAKRCEIGDPQINPDACCPAVQSLSLIFNPERHIPPAVGLKSDCRSRRIRG